MFEDATFHSRGLATSQTPKWMLLTLTVNLTVVVALIAIPLINPESLPARLLQRALLAPPPVLAVQPQAHTQPAASMQTVSLRNPYAAPIILPTRINTDPVPPFQSTTLLNPMPGGVVGSDLPSTALFHTDPPPAVHPAASPARVPVSGGVIEGFLVYRSTPSYPPMAKTARVSGTVVLAATISKSGTIENLRVLTGHPMLIQSAIEAVKTWRYRPYLLNNQPVEVETTINVVFSMGTR
jgi:periplasmic protein TonB